ncbi:hypothetical protein QTP86_026882 [Hemibagrus guttatus]|nr:hypothetical protein QTP86_026882 [Hemibagrus guttatus]
MDQLSEEVRQESPWTMMFADDIVICSESREQVEENLERWRFALERRGMKVSRSKTEYMCVNEREGSGTIRLQGEEVKKVQEFKYLGSTVQSNGECEKEVKKRVQAGWNGWRKVLGVLCDQKISARIKGKVYRTVVRAAMLYGLETVSLRKRQESELEVAELKMLRLSLGVTRLDRIRNEYIRGTAHVGRLGDKLREARLRWFGHVQRRESEYIGRRMLDMELPGRRQRGRPKRRYMDGINEDMKLVGARVEDAEDRDRSEYRTQTMPELQKLHPSSMIREDMALTVCGAQQWESIKNRLCTRSMTQTSLRRTGKGFSEQVGASNMMIQAKWGDSGSASVLFTMLQERENLVTAPEHVLLSIKRTFPNPKLGFVRSVLHRSDIESIGKDDKLSILEYVLSDGRYEELNGLQLLPLSDGSFRSFTNQEEDTALIDNEKFSRFKALTTDKFGCKTM